MDPTAAAPPPPPKDVSQSQIATGKTGTSALGSPKQISDRLSSFMQSRENGDTTKTKEKLPLPEPKKKDAPTDGKDKEKTELNGKDKPDAAQKDKEKEITDDKEKRGTDGLTKEERAQVVEFKKRAEAAESRIKELETKATEGEASKKELAELRKLEKERQSDYDRNEREIAAIRIQGTKKYQETIAKPLQAYTSKIEEIAKGCNLDPDDVFGTIGMNDLVKRNSKLKEHIEAMDPLTAETFKQCVNGLLDLEPKAKRLDAEAREAWQAMQLEEKEASEREEQQKRETYLKASDAVWEEMIKRVPTLNDPEIAKQVREKADNFNFAKAEADLQAFAALSAYSVIHLQAALDAKDEENTRLKESVKRLGGERVGPASAATKTEDTTSKFEGKDSGSRFNAWRTGTR